MGSSLHRLTENAAVKEVAFARNLVFIPKSAESDKFSFFFVDFSLNKTEKSFSK